MRAAGRGRPLVLRGVPAFPVLWVIGLGAVFWPVLAALGVRPIARSRFDGAMFAVLGVIVALVLSCGIGAAAGYAGAGRVIGLAANVSVWVGMLGLLAAEQGADRATRLRFLRVCVVVGTLHSVLALGALAVYPTALPVPLLGGMADRLPSGIGNFTSRELIDQSWAGGEVLRTVGMMAQPTWSGAVAALTVLLTMFLFPTLSRWARVAAVPGMFVNLGNVYFSYGRATQIGLVAVLLLVVVRLLVRRWRFGPALVVLAAGATVVGAVLAAGTLVETVVEVNDTREGSADARGAIYERTLALIGMLRVPLLGYGVKPAEEGLIANVATHSSYLGLLFRAGILGVLAFAVFLCLLLRRCLRAESGLPVAIVVFTAIWCVFEDVDAGHLVPLLLVGAVFAAGTTRREEPVAVEPPPDGIGRLIEPSSSPAVWHRR